MMSLLVLIYAKMTLQEVSMTDLATGLGDLVPVNVEGRQSGLPARWSGRPPGPSPVIERHLAALAGSSRVVSIRPSRTAAVTDAVPIVRPRPGSRMHRRKVLFGCVLVENVAYVAPELDRMLILEPVLVWTHREESDAVVGTSRAGPFFAARRAGGQEAGR